MDTDRLEAGYAEMANDAHREEEALEWAEDMFAQTLEVVADKDLMADLRQSISEMESGATISWEEAKRELTKSVGGSS
jgi:phosphoenolpyruvate-protein kinase (PTS system EI component)